MTTKSQQTAEHNVTDKQTIDQNNVTDEQQNKLHVTKQTLCKQTKDRGENEAMSYMQSPKNNSIYLMWDRGMDL